jgi:glycerol-3-phosphate dehydrogenase
VDDARLVVLNAIDAARRGADIRIGTEFTTARREDGLWRIELQDSTTGSTETIRARTLVNASGPWIQDVIGCTNSADSQARIRLVKGSHIVVPRLFEHERAYIFQNADQRIIFAIPFAVDFTLIGTTDVDFMGEPDAVEISLEEIDYLCASASEYFVEEIRTSDVVWSYSGVRPLYDDGETSAQETTRDYVLDLQAPNDDAALLNIFGGKITTYRRLAEESLEKLRKQLPEMGAAWTAEAPLPGGDFPIEGFDRLVMELQQEHPTLDRDLVRRYARAYGTETRTLLHGVTMPNELGTHFGAGLYQREVEYLVKQEWARCADDIVWRRSKLGLKMSAAQIAHLEQWLSAGPEAMTASAG